MTTANTTITTAPKKASVLVLMAERLNVDPDKMLATLKATICPKSSNEEIMAFCIVCQEHRLNPFVKEIYAFPGKSGGIVPMVSIDGWIRIINDHPKMDGIEFKDDHVDGKLFSCTCTIWRKDRNRPIQVTEYLSECKRNTDPWKMESRMLRHKALIQCARVAFGFSGIYDEDEAKEVAGIRNVTPRDPDTNPFEDAPVIVEETPAPEEPKDLWDAEGGEP